MLKIGKDLKIDTFTKPVVGKLHHAHCSGIVAFPDGELLAVFYWALREADSEQAIYAVRKKLGEDWSEPEVIMTDRFRMVGNPAIWIAPDTGKLFLFFVRSWGGWAVCNPRVSTSDDKGKTWSKSKSLYWFISRGIKNPAIRLSNGNYLLPAYVEFRDYFSVFYLSKDQGKTWKDVGARVKINDEEVPPEMNFKWGRLVLQPTIVERQDGSILCLMRAKRPLGKMYFSESFDHGMTWSSAKPYILPNPGGGFHMIRLKSGALAVIYNHAPVLPDLLYERNPLSVALSEDDGKSWTFRRNILEGQNELQSVRIGGYPTICQGEDGVIHATWSFSSTETIQGTEYHFTDIKYTSFTEEWIREKQFFNTPWEEN